MAGTVINGHNSVTVPDEDGRIPGEDDAAINPGIDGENPAIGGTGQVTVPDGGVIIFPADDNGLPVVNPDGPVTIPPAKVCPGRRKR